MFQKLRARKRTHLIEIFMNEKESFALGNEVKVQDGVEEMLHFLNCRWLGTFLRTLNLTAI
jgi:hypothetical protein